ncbi:Nuf2 family-domain-containing protein [Syncephalis fuscata]|nr:Nuf2 family-domain-containing protein [Syncephalis fuscata]
MDYGRRQSLQPMKASYIFPTLKTQEILTCLHELQIPFSEDDLQRPSHMRMMSVYESICYVFMGVSREDIVSIDKFTSNMSYPDLYQNALVSMSFYRYLSRFMQAIGIDDFGFKDLAKPEPGRVRRIMSAVINFAKFREERMDVLDQFTIKSEELLDQHALLQQQNEQLKEHLKSIKIQQERELAQVQKLEEEKSGIQSELREMNKQQTRLNAEIEEQKQEKGQLSDKMTSAQFELIEVKQEIGRLQARIVPSPEKLQELIDKLNADLVNTRQKISVEELKAHEFQSRISNIQYLAQDVEACKQLMQDCLEETENCQNITREITILCEKVEKKELEIHDLTYKLESQERQITKAKDMLEKLHVQHQQQQEIIAHKMDRLHEDYGELQRESTVYAQKIIEYQELITEKEAQMAELHKDVEQEISSIQMSYMRLRQQVEVYLVKVQRHLVIPKEHE